MKHIHLKQSICSWTTFTSCQYLCTFTLLTVFQSKTSDPVWVVGMQPERSNSGLNAKLRVKPVFMYEASEASPWQRGASSPFSIITINDFISSVFFYFCECNSASCGNPTSHDFVKRRCVTWVFTV